MNRLLSIFILLVAMIPLTFAGEPAGIAAPAAHSSDQLLFNILDTHSPFNWDGEQIMSPAAGGNGWRGCSWCHGPGITPTASPHEKEAVADTFEWSSEQIMSPGGSGNGWRGCSWCHAPSIAPETSPHVDETMADIPKLKQPGLG